MTNAIQFIRLIQLFFLLAITSGVWFTLGRFEETQEVFGVQEALAQFASEDNHATNFSHPTVIDTEGPFIRRLFPLGVLIAAIAVWSRVGHRVSLWVARCCS